MILSFRSRVLGSDICGSNGRCILDWQKLLLLISSPNFPYLTGICEESIAICLVWDDYQLLRYLEKVV
jgi:hypothetical protein